jgi:hypothetical protein
MGWKSGVGHVILIAVAAAAAIVPLPPAWVERAYSMSVYPRIQGLLTPMSNRAPFALFDVLIMIVATASLLAFILDIAAGRYGAFRVFGRFLMRTTVLAASFYLVFLLVWGLNYRREKLTEKLQFDAGSISADAALAAATADVEQLNALHDRAHEAGWHPLTEIDPALRAAFGLVTRDLGALTMAVAGRPKVTLFNPYFRRAGVEGMTAPYFLETLVQREILPFERPFVVAHEWSHLAGFADEAEANFVGWLTCLRGSTPDQYSGWLFLYSELARAVRARDRAAVSALLDPGPRADLVAIAARYREQVNPRVSAVGWRVYDRYLKANRVEAGTASYDEMVRLVLGVRFGPDWTPVRRTGESSKVKVESSK